MSVGVALHVLAPEQLVLTREQCVAMLQEIVALQAKMLPPPVAAVMQGQPLPVGIMSFDLAATLEDSEEMRDPHAVPAFDRHEVLAPWEPLSWTPPTTFPQPLQAGGETLWFYGSDRAAIRAALPNIPFGSQPLVVDFHFAFGPTLYLLRQPHPMVFTNAYDSSRQYYTSAYCWYIGSENEPPMYPEYPISRVITRYFGGIIPVYSYH